MQRWAQKRTQIIWTEKVLKRGGKNTWKNYTKKKIIQTIQKRSYKLYKKDPDNHDAVITHLEPDILECKIKWALVKKHHMNSF